MPVAGDTYRAAAVEQIETWSDRLNVRLVQNPNTTDPASVAFDGVESGMSRGESDIDTGKTSYFNEPCE